MQVTRALLETAQRDSESSSLETFKNHLSNSWSLMDLLESASSIKEKLPRYYHRSE